MRMRAVPLVAVLLLLAACGTRPEPAPLAPGIGGAGAGGAAAPIGRVDRSSAAAMQQDLAQIAGDRIFFDYDSSEISPEAQQILKRQAEWLQRYPSVHVTIEGHTDERGTREYNLSLGERRAQAVKGVLIALGIPASRLSTISYGKERPVIAHSDEQSYAQNRRAVTVVN